MKLFVTALLKGGVLLVCAMQVSCYAAMTRHVQSRHDVFFKS